MLNDINKIGDTLFEAIKYTVGASCFSGGVWCGVMIPDWDITQLGIGFHRNFLYHSATPAAAAKCAHRFIFNKIRAYNEEKGLLSQDKLDLIDKAAALYVAGFALGQAGHFIADATWQGSKAILWRIPGIGDLKSLTGSNSLIPGTLLDDHFWLFGNTIWALKIAWEELKYALGKEHPMIKAISWIGRKLEELWDWTKNKIIKAHKYLTCTDKPIPELRDVEKPPLPDTSKFDQSFQNCERMRKIAIQQQVAET